MEQPCHARELLLLIRKAQMPGKGYGKNGHVDAVPVGVFVPPFEVGEGQHGVGITLEGKDDGPDAGFSPCNVCTAALAGSHGGFDMGVGRSVRSLCLRNVA